MPHTKAPAARVSPDIRPAVAADIDRLSEILVFAKRTAYRGIFRDDYASFHDLTVRGAAEEYLQTPARLAETLVYDDGFIKGLLHRRALDGAAQPRCMELCELYVEPFFTGTGVGGALMTRFLSDAIESGAGRAVLWVLCENARARKFYEAFGFRATGETQLVPGTEIAEMRYARTL